MALLVYDISSHEKHQKGGGLVPDSNSKSDQAVGYAAWPTHLVPDCHVGKIFQRMRCGMLGDWRHIGVARV